MPSNSKNTMAYCPECDSKVNLKKSPRLGDIIVCKACETSLEVVELNPLELDWAFEDAYTDDDEYDDYDYEEVDDDDDYADDEDEELPYVDLEEDEIYEDANA